MVLPDLSLLRINKIDKKDARINEVIDEVYDLFLDLNASDDQLDFPILYGIAKEGIVRYEPEDTKNFEFGSYVYDIQIELANGDIYTFIPLSNFNITGEVV